MIEKTTDSNEMFWYYMQLLYNRKFNISKSGLGCVLCNYSYSKIDIYNLLCGPPSMNQWDN